MPICEKFNLKGTSGNPNPPIKPEFGRCLIYSQIDSHFGDGVKEPNIWYILYNAIRREDFFSRKIDHFIQGEKMGKSGNYFIQYDKNTY